MARKAHANNRTLIPVKTEGRNSFGIAYFTTEDDADAYARSVARRGDTHNGGMFHGSSCGRDARFDHTDATLGKLYAVTTR